MKIRALVSKCAVGAVLALTTGFWTHLQAQNFDFSGQWEMTTDIFLPERVNPCVYAGIAQIILVPAKGFIRGTVELDLVTGPVPCPAEMAGEITGNLDGATIYNGVLFGGILGEATFTGSLMAADTIAKGMVVGGSLDVIVGPYVGATGGAWSAIVSEGVFRDGFESLIMLSGGTSLLALAAAGMFIRRRRRI